MKDLGRLYKRFLQETAILEVCFENAGLQKCDEMMQEMSVIRLYDAWQRFCRGLIVFSSYGAYTLNGNHIPEAPNSHLLNPSNPHQPFGPRWHGWGDSTQCIHAAQQIGIANFSQVSMGLGLTPSPVDDLRKVRNFFAHRNIGTAQIAQQVAQSVGVQVQRPIELIKWVQSPGITVFEYWVIHLRQMAHIAVQ